MPWPHLYFSPKTKTFVKMKAFKFALFSAVAFTVFSCGDDYNDYQAPKRTTTDIVTDSRQMRGPVEAQKNLEFPALSQMSGNVVIVHKSMLNDARREQGINYSVEWNITQQTQHWTCYKAYGNIIRSSSSVNNVTRYYADNDGSLSATCQYPNDPELPSQYRFTSDPYKGSGYDHGHICPSADRLRATEANYQTFFITNMQPQTPAFNGTHRTIKSDWSPWYRLEDRTRTWAGKSDTLYVCKGGVIGSNPSYIGSGSNRIPVPEYFFVALLSKKGNDYHAVGFWMKHESSYDRQHPLSEYTMSIQELEGKTGLDFFCNLRDDIEIEVETVDKATLLSDWDIQ